MLRLLPWLTTLSLDAPLVAIAWQALLAERTRTQLQWHHRVLVFASVWLGYTADRWLDARRAEPEASRRHAWHGRHSLTILTVWTATLAASLALAWQTLSQLELQRGFILMAASVGYTTLAHLVPDLRIEQTLKTFGVGLLVTGAAALYAISWPDFGLPIIDELGAVALLFALNCALLRRWEVLPESRPRATELVCATLALLGAFYGAPSPALCIAILVSLLALSTLEYTRHRLCPEMRRSLADVALLSPFLVLPFA